MDPQSDKGSRGVGPVGSDRETIALCLLRAADTLILWKADVIRDRRWRLRANLIALLAAIVYVVGGLRRFDSRFLVAAWVLVALAFVVHIYAWLGPRTRARHSRSEWMEHLKVPLGYGDDDQAIAARRQLQDVENFDR